METKFQPYVGPRPYERDDLALFFGRDYEADELLSLIISYRELLFYAQSGTGKTSLLNAKVIPFLEKEGFEILPLARVQGMISPDVRPDDFFFQAEVGIRDLTVTGVQTCALPI